MKSSNSTLREKEIEIPIQGVFKCVYTLTSITFSLSVIIMYVVSFRSTNPSVKRTKLFNEVGKSKPVINNDCGWSLARRPAYGWMEEKNCKNRVG